VFLLIGFTINKTYFKTKEYNPGDLGVLSEAGGLKNKNEPRRREGRKEFLVNRLKKAG